MKLKSKLIATIVSICAAIAVMGVGVWAAQASFTVTVNNTVSLAFHQLDGQVKQNAAYAGASDTASKDTLKGTGDTLLQGEADAQYWELAAVVDPIYKPADGALTHTVENTTFAGFLNSETNIDARKTAKAMVEYNFEYVGTGITAGSSSVKVHVSAHQIGTVTGAERFEAKYLVSTDGTNWYVISKTAGIVFDAATASVKVKAVLIYENTDLSSVQSSDGAVWNFSIMFESAAASASTGAGDLANSSTTFVADAIHSSATMTPGSVASDVLHTYTVTGA